MSSEPLIQKNKQEENQDAGFNFSLPETATASEAEFLLPQLSVKLKHDVKQNIWIVRWGKRKLVEPFVVILRRGLEPKLLSWSVALGLTFGLFPFYGVALLLCAISAMVLQSDCHVPTLMLANLIASPFQIGMVVPFMRAGEIITRGEHFEFSPGGLWEAIKGHQSRALIFGILHAAIGWSVFAPLFIGFIYVASLPVFQYLIGRFRTNQVIQPSDKDQQVINKQETNECGCI